MDILIEINNRIPDNRLSNIEIQTNLLGWLSVGISKDEVFVGNKLYESMTAVLYPTEYIIKDHKYVINQKPFDDMQIGYPDWLRNKVVTLNKDIPEFVIINCHKYRLWSTLSN
jgi:hypothetical protein